MSLLIILVIGWILVQPNFGWVKYKPEIYGTLWPTQENDISAVPFEHKGYTIVPRAEFDLNARVLSKRRYFLGKESSLAPFDLALGWGQMANYLVIKKLKIFQMMRWYSYFYKEAPLRKNDIVTQSANMHLIAANKDVDKQIKKVKRGAVVKLKGYLVDVRAENGWKWRTSMRRNDAGAGSCEIIWVKEFDVQRKK